MKLNPEKFNRFLNSIGQRFIWRPAFACPCVSQNSGQPKVNCKHCYGLGRLWGEGKEALAGVVGKNTLKKIVPFGIYDARDTCLSIPSDSAMYGIGMFDRVTSVDKTEPFSQNLVYGINDRLKFTPIAIERVIWIDGNDTIVEGTLPIVNVDNSLVWQGTTPPAKTTYSITGRRNADYYCYMDLALDRPEQQGSQLPRRVILRSFDLFTL